MVCVLGVCTHLEGDCSEFSHCNAHVLQHAALVSEHTKEALEVG